MADSRDMVGAHDMFRHHFGALPELIRGVAPGDTGRATVVAEHAEFLALVLDGHHSAEDTHVWPRLHDRCPGEVQRLVDTMETQHQVIHTGLDTLVADARHWAADAGPDTRDSLAEVAENLNVALTEHLTLEEAEVLRLIDRYLTEDEWRATVAAGGAKLTPETAPIVLGMILDTADERMTGILRSGMPAEFWDTFRPVAIDAYGAYAKRVFATA